MQVSAACHCMCGLNIMQHCDDVIANKLSVKSMACYNDLVLTSGEVKLAESRKTTWRVTMDKSAVSVGGKQSVLGLWSGNGGLGSGEPLIVGGESLSGACSLLNAVVYSCYHGGPLSCQVVEVVVEHCL